MFVHVARSMKICEGTQAMELPAGFIGEVPEWVACHWYFKAALTDGTVCTTGIDTEPDKARRPIKKAHEPV